MLCRADHRMGSTALLKRDANDHRSLFLGDPACAQPP
jgi:hypothetical protein